MQLKYWILAARPFTLVVGIGPILLGLTLFIAQAPSSINAPLNIMILLCMLGLQISTHFFNDALDFIKGNDTKNRLGPQRMVQAQHISAKSMITAGIVGLIVTGGMGLYVVLYGGGWPIFVIGLISLSLAYLYTGGPYPLSYTGLSDIFVLLFFGFIPVMGVFYINAGFISMDSLIAGGQCGFLALSLLIVNHLRDRKEDKQAGKKTWIVRWGLTFGMIEWAIARYMPYGLSLYWFFKTQYMVAFLPWVLWPFSFFLHYLLLKAHRQALLYNLVLKLTCLYHVLFVTLMMVALLVS